MTGEYAIETQNLSKKYDKSERFALSKLNLQIGYGEAYGFLGPNGAGKSTAIRLLMNFIIPSSGTATILGKSVDGKHSQIRGSIGYLSGDFVAYPSMTGEQFINYLSAITPPKDNKIVKDLAKLFELNLAVPIRALSKGNRQKLGLIQAFMSEPQIIIMDEPTSGLDPLKQEIFYDLVKTAKNRGDCVFVSSHNLSEVQKMCDRVGIIREGKLVHQAKISNIALEASQTIELHFSNKPPVNQIKKLAGVHRLQQSENILTIHYHGDLKPLFVILANNTVTKIVTHEVDLEDEFMRFYEKGKTS